MGISSYTAVGRQRKEKIIVLVHLDQPTDRILDCVNVLNVF